MYQTARKILGGLLTLTLLFLQPFLTTASTSPTNILSITITTTTRTTTVTSIPAAEKAALVHETSTVTSLAPTNDPAPVLETITNIVDPARHQETITVVTSCIGYNTDAAGSTHCYPNPEPTYTTTIIVPSSGHTNLPSMNNLLLPGTLVMALVVGFVPALLFVLVFRLGWVKLYF